MAESVFSLFGELILDDKKYQQSLRDAERGTERAGRNMQRTWDQRFDRMQRGLDTFGRRLQRVGSTMSTRITAPIAAMGGAALLAANRLGNTADRLLDLEQMTGLSTDRLQEFQNVARAAGVESETLSGAAEGLTRRLRAGGEESATFTDSIGRLGVSTKNADGSMRDMDALMPEIIGKLGDVESITERNAISMQLFGRRATELAPVLALGSDEIERLSQEAHEMGDVMSRDALNAANEYRIEMEQLTAELGIAGREITQSLMPILHSLVTVMRNNVIPWIQNMADRIEGAFEWFTNLSEGTQKFIGIAVAGLAAAGPVVMAVGATTRAISGLMGVVRTLRTLMLVSMGPAGWITLAVTALAGLGFAFAGRRGSLDRAINTAADETRDMKDAIGAATDRDSLAGTIASLSEGLEGDAATALQTYAQEIRNTKGDLSDLKDEALETVAAIVHAEEIARIDAEIRALQIRQTGLGTTRGYQSDAITRAEQAREEAQDRVSQIEQEIQDHLARVGGDAAPFAMEQRLRNAEGMLESAQRSLEAARSASEADADAVGEAADGFDAQIERLEAQKAEILDGVRRLLGTNGGGSGSGATGGTGGAGGTGGGTTDTDAVVGSIRYLQEQLTAERKVFDEAVTESARDASASRIQILEDELADMQAILASADPVTLEVGEITGLDTVTLPNLVPEVQTGAYDFRTPQERARDRRMADQLRYGTHGRDYTLAAGGGVDLPPGTPRASAPDTVSLPDVDPKLLGEGIGLGVTPVLERVFPSYEEARREGILLGQARFGSPEAQTAMSENARRQAIAMGGGVGLGVTPGASSPGAVPLPTPDIDVTGEVQTWMQEAGEAAQDFGNHLLNVAKDKIPALGAAIDTIAAGGGVFDVFSAVLGTIVGKSEAFQNLLEAVNSLLDPIVAALRPLFEAITKVVEALGPLFEIVGSLIEGALQPLVWVLENVVVPVFEFVADAIRGIYNALFGWVLGKIEKDNQTSGDGFVAGTAGSDRQMIHDVNGTTYRTGLGPDLPVGSLAWYDAIIRGLEEHRHRATSADEIAALDDLIAEYEQRRDKFDPALGNDPLSPDLPEDPISPIGTTGSGDVLEEMNFGGTPQSVQMAVATPLVDAAALMHDAVERLMGDGGAFDSLAALDGRVFEEHASAMREHTDALMAWVDRGVDVRLGKDRTQAFGLTAHLRGI